MEQLFFVTPDLWENHASTQIKLNSVETNLIFIFEVLNSEFWIQSKMWTYHLWKPIWNWFWANCLYQILTLWLKLWKVGWKTWFKSSWIIFEFGSITKVSNYFFHCISQRLKTKCDIPNAKYIISLFWFLFVLQFEKIIVCLASSLLELLHQK